MTMMARAESLRRQHEQLEAELKQVMSHPSADDTEIRRIKERKLSIKDEIAALEAVM